jgi:hypothetical protein
MSEQQTSRRELPPSFFYFSALTPGDRRLWFEQVLIDNKAYFRSRDQLNDPTELRPAVVFEGTDKQKRAFVKRLMRAHSPRELPPAKRLVEESRLIRELSNAPQVFEREFHRILDRVGIFCLSEIATSSPFWAYYADGHKGACVEFDRDLGFFVMAQPIVYTDEPRVINRLVDSHEELFNKSMCFNGTAWSHEHEWRVIARFEDVERATRYKEQHSVALTAQTFMGDQHGPGYYSFPSQAIRSVILGQKASVETESWLREVVERAPSHISIKRASVSNSGVVTVS